MLARQRPSLLSHSNNPSFSSVSVRCRRAFSFKRRLTDTYDLGNLPKTGTGFAKVHANLRKIPEGDEKYGRWRSLFFYRSRMTGIYNSSFSSVSVRCRRAFSFSGGLRTLTTSGISLRLAQALLKFTVALGRFPNRRKYGRLSAPYFLPFENDEVGGYFSTVRE